MNKFLRGFNAVLIDMDGVLYDSMKLHTLAWKRMMDSLGVECTRDEFYLYEGMTGAATIRLLYRRAFGRDVSDVEAQELYRIKTENFRRLGKAEPMPGADRMLEAFRRAGLRRVLVTGSGQANLLDALNAVYPDAFMPGDRVTSHDVVHGKPHPEPYLKGMEIAGADARNSLVIENAPLGVRAGKAAGAFTVAVTTGPIPREEFEKENADLIFSSMPEFADWLESMEEESEIFRCSDPDRDIRALARGLRPDRTAILTDSNVRPVAEKVLPGLFAKSDAVMEIPAGEKSKNLDETAKIWRRMIDARISRDSVIVNVGGGVVTDMGGFAAATFKRGVRFINVPTTLLGIADAAVGGKTGIDFSGLKNEVGAFAPASAVAVSGEWLLTLPRRELLSGFAEVVKCAIISGEEALLNLVYDPNILDEPEKLERAAAMAAGYKENIVRQDPKESGLRKILNFGHTWGHAYESLALRRGIPMTHGEAVAHGMMRALEISRDRNGYPPEKVENYREKILERHYPPLPFNETDRPELEELMRHDKKNRGVSDTPDFVLLRADYPSSSLKS